MIGIEKQEEQKPNDDDDDDETKKLTRKMSVLNDWSSVMCKTLSSLWKQ